MQANNNIFVILYSIGYVNQENEEKFKLITKDLMQFFSDDTYYECYPETKPLLESLSKVNLLMIS